jgi:hypothetical protein
VSSFEVGEGVLAVGAVAVELGDGADGVLERGDEDRLLVAVVGA